MMPSSPPSPPLPPHSSPNSCRGQNTGVLTPVGGSYLRLVGSRHIEGVLLRIYTNTTQHSSTQTQVIHGASTSTSRRGASTACHRGYRASATTKSRQRCVLPVLSHSQERWIPQVYSQSLAPQQVYSVRTFPHNHSSRCHSSMAARQHLGRPRLEECVLPYFHQHHSSMIYAFCGEWTIL